MKVARELLTCVALLCLLAACSKHKESSKTGALPATVAQHADPCASELAAAIKDNPVPLLCAAGQLFPFGEAICDSTFGIDWATFDPPDLADASTEEKIGTGVDSLCTQLRSMPPGEAGDAAGRLKAWVDTYLEVAPIENEAPEAFGTGTAYVKEIADLLPKDIAMRAPSKAETGNSMATAEFTELMYGITTRLSALSPGERERILAELKSRAGQAVGRQK